MNHEKYRELLTGFLDKELSPEEMNEVNEHINRCESCRKEYNEMRETMKKLDTLSFDEPEDIILENLWKKPYNKFQKIAGLVMVIGGYLVLMLYAFYEIIRDKSLESIPKISILALIIGFFILLVTVIRERMKTYKVDKYKEIKR